MGIFTNPLGSKCIVDDAGTSVPAFDPRQAQRGSDGKEDASLTELRVRLLRSSIGSLSEAPILMRIAISMTGLVGVATYFVSAWVAPNVSRWLIIGAAVLAAIVWARVWRARMLRGMEIMFVATLLSEGRCGSCGYAISGVPDIEGLVKCPECGAAWRKTRLGGLRPTSSAVASAAAKPLGSVLGPPSVTDARGRSVRMIDISRDPLARLLGRERAAEVRGTALRATRIDRWKWMTLLACSSAMMCLALYGIWGPGGGAIRIAPFRTLILSLPVVFGLVTFMLTGIKISSGKAQRTAKKVAVAVLQAGVCPGCGAEMSAAVNGPDGFRECAGCGAAWP